MSRSFPGRNWNDFSPISINANYPFLEKVSSTAHPGLYQCRWQYKTVNGKIVPMQVILKRFDQVENYPHLTIEFDGTGEVILEFHYSFGERDENGDKIAYGSKEIKELIRLLPSMFTILSTNDALAILDSE